MNETWFQKGWWDNFQSKPSKHETIAKTDAAAAKEYQRGYELCEADFKELACGSPKSDSNAI